MATKRAIKEQTLNNPIFNLLVDSIQESVTISQISEDGSSVQYVFANEVMLRRLGYTMEELLQLSPFDIHTTDDQQKLLEIRAAILNGQNMKNIECEQVPKSGATIPVQISLKHAELNGIKYMICTSHDMNEGKKMAADLEEKSEKYRALCDCYNDAVFISEKGRCIEQNLAAEKMFGYTNEEAHGMFGTAWIAEEDRALVKNNMLSGYEEPYEALAIRKDGFKFPCLLHGSMMNYRGRTVRVTTLKDLTHQKKLEQLKEKEEEEIKNIISAMKVGLLLFNAGLKITFCNKVAEEILGISKEEILKKPTTASSWKLLEESSKKILDELPIQKVLKEKIVINNTVIGYHNPKENRDEWLMYDMIPQLDNEGNIERIICTFVDISERIELENELLKNKTLYKEIINHNTLAVTLLNPDHSYKFINRKFEESTGFSQHEIIDKNPSEFIHQDDLPALLVKLDLMVKNPGSTVNAQYRYLKKDGSYIWVDSSFTNLLHIKDLETILITSSDVINEKKLGEEKVTVIEKEYGTLIDNLLIGFAYNKVEYKENGELLGWTYLKVNKRFGEIIEQENLVGKSTVNLFDNFNETESILFITVNRVVQTGISESIEYYNHYFNKWIAATFYSFNKSSFFCLLDDITQVKIADEIVQETNKKLLQAEKIAKIGYWELDFKNKRVYGSEGSNRIYGNESSPITIEQLKSYRLPDYVDKVDQAMKDLIEKNIPYDIEFKIKRKTDGEIIDIHSIADYDPKTQLLFGVIQDVTEFNKIKNQLEEQNQELQKTNSELDKFVYSTSHDLRAPLKSVLGLINLIETEDEAMLIKEQMQMMKTSVVKLDDFIEDIMHYYRNTKLVINPEEINFNEVLESVLYNLSGTLGFSKIKFEKIINTPSVIKSDKQRLTVILNNLISNAIKYIDNNRQEHYTKIEIIQNVVSIHITIEDNGIGIAPNDVQKIFEMFYRATKRSTGSGLGLYIVKETVEKLGGHIIVESEFGKWTRFTIKLPNMHE